MIVYGKNAVLTLLNHPERIRRLVIQKGLEAPYLSAIKNLPLERVDKATLIQTYGEETQGFVAEVEPIKMHALEDVLSQSPKRLVVLDGIMDPHNLGAIIRSAKAFNADAVIMRKKRSAPVTAAVYKASAGLIESIPLVEVANIHQTLRVLKDKNIWIYGLAAEGDLSLKSVQPDSALALVLGNEGDGLSSLVKKTCDFLVTIPMNTEVESLNVSVAAAIALFHLS